MIIFPAIDIRGGRCVRLVEGDFARETAFDADPAEAGRRWVAAGARWLHVVDLDAARGGQPVNTAALARIRAACGVPIQYGGGLRTISHLETVFDLGVDRAVLGTAAIHNDGLVSDATTRWTSQIAAGLDARDGMLAGAGWLEQTAIPATKRAQQLRDLGVEHMVFTDIRRDGTLTGPNLAAMRALAHDLDNGAALIASGGVGSLTDVSDVAATGVAGVIIGRALYDGRIDLESALQAAEIRIGTAT